jgi:hypothetical protein
LAESKTRTDFLGRIRVIAYKNKIKKRQGCAYNTNRRSKTNSGAKAEIVDEISEDDDKRIVILYACTEIKWKKYFQHCGTGG